MITFRGRHYDLPLVNTIHKAVMARWDDSNSMTFPSSFPMSVDGLNCSLQEMGWLSLDSKPSLFVDEIETELSNNWDWLRGSDMTSFGHRFWNAELGCDTSEELSWWYELDVCLSQKFDLESQTSLCRMATVMCSVPVVKNNMEMSVAVLTTSKSFGQARH